MRCGRRHWRSAAGRSAYCGGCGRRLYTDDDLAWPLLLTVTVASVLVGLVAIACG